jgi:hypothetical protein
MDFTLAAEKRKHEIRKGDITENRLVIFPKNLNYIFQLVIIVVGII